MISVKKEGIVLTKTLLPFEDEGVLNPAIIQEDNTVHMLYRAVRKGNYSSIGYCRFEGPLHLVERSETPVISPYFDYEAHGIEDPRIVNIEGVYYITYTAYDGVNALGALCTSTDLKNFERLGVILPQITYEKFKRLAECSGPLNIKYERFYIHTNIFSNPDKSLLLWDKNLIFFPRKIDNKFYFLHRIKPDIQIVAVNNLQELTQAFWENYLLHLKENIVLSSQYKHESSYVGGGCPPIETGKGWLVIYHGVHDTPNGYVYCACASLLALDNPQKELARLPYPLFEPDLDWEIKGYVNNVVFPTGTALFDDTLYIYYGAADKRIACASVSISDLLTELTNNTKTP